MPEYGANARRRPARYDLIMLDAFNGDYIPEHLMTREYLQEIRELLVDGGVVASNTFAISQLYHNESVTYDSVFGIFYNLKSPDTANRVIIARRGPLPDRQELDRMARCSAAGALRCSDYHGIPRRWRSRQIGIALRAC